MRRRISRRFNPLMTGTMIVAAILIVYIAAAFTGLDRFWTKNSNQRVLASVDAIKRAAVQCYALEGSYPPDISYLEEHYGLVLNRDKFYYYYQTFGSNIMPQVGVYEKSAVKTDDNGVPAP